MPRTHQHAPDKLPNLKPFKRAMSESGLPYTTGRDAHFRGELAVVKIGRAWYVDVAEMARFVERHTVRMAG